MADPLNEVSPVVLVKMTSLMAKLDAASAEFVVDASRGVETEELAPMEPPMAVADATPGPAAADAATGTLSCCMSESAVLPSSTTFALAKKMESARHTAVPVTPGMSNPAATIQMRSSRNTWQPLHR